MNYDALCYYYHCFWSWTCISFCMYIFSFVVQRHRVWNKAELFQSAVSVVVHCTYTKVTFCLCPLMLPSLKTCIDRVLMRRCTSERWCWSCVATCHRKSIYHADRWRHAVGSRDSAGVGPGVRRGGGGGGCLLPLRRRLADIALLTLTLLRPVFTVHRLSGGQRPSEGQ